MKTLELAKALQFWANWSCPPGAHGKQQLAECIKDLREEMKLMATFTNEDVINNDPPSPWKRVTPSRGTMKGEEKLWEAVGAWSRSKMERARPQGFSKATPLLGCSRPLITPSTMVAVTTSAPTTPSQQTIFAQVLWPQGRLTGRRLAQLPKFQEISWSL